MSSDWKTWDRDQWEWFYREYKLPVFKSKDEAVEWSNKTKWIEPIRRMFYRKIQDLREVAYYNSHKLTVTSIHTAGEIMQLVSYYETALAMMEQYKERKEVGDPAQVGAVVYAGSEVVSQEEYDAYQATHYRNR